MAAPRATYRIQFREAFPFQACAEQAPYFARLGISHIYASPILTARAGSAHGYDVVRHDTISAALGGEAGFRHMAQTLRAQGIGIILDIVPNHMAVGGGDNPIWLDVLKHGRGSRFARWFDIDFDVPDPLLKGRIHLPFLGDDVEALLAGGELTLAACEDTEGHCFAYAEHVFPIRPEDDAWIRAEGLISSQRREALRALLDRQHYRLDVWRTAGDRINWRRFFDITSLAALRMDVPEAYDAVHIIPLALYAEGLIDGLRIDHIDGLADPAVYCRKLRADLAARQSHRPDAESGTRAWLVVEKILAADEPLPADWDVDGSTGYDFMDQVSAFQHDGAGEGILSAHWSALSGRWRSFHDEENLARRDILDTAFDGQRARLVRALARAGEDDPFASGVTVAALTRACTQALVAMRAYRGYAVRADDDGAPGPSIIAALECATLSPLADRAALDQVRRVLSGVAMHGQASAAAQAYASQALALFNQIAAPLAAKAVEDTAFYRYGRLLSRNDVGFDAARLHMSPEAFHATMMARAASQPLSMLATATHDHKRGEDVRARLAVLSEMPVQWTQSTARWSKLTSALMQDALTPADVYMFQQMVVGAWPHGLAPDDVQGLRHYAERLIAWWIKALREGKLRSSWTQPSEAVERAASDFVLKSLDPRISGAFLRDVHAFVETIAPAGAANSLVQLVLRCLVPGVSDVYQGTEFWDFSLVDPDNRTPVDYAARAVALEAAAEAEAGAIDADAPFSQLCQTWKDGRIKQAILRHLLAMRRKDPALFSRGDYEPVPITGLRAGNVLAFRRVQDNESVLVIVTRCTTEGLQPGALVPEAQWWGETVVEQGGRSTDWTPVIGPSIQPDGRIRMAAIVPHLPFAVWRASAPV